MSEEFDDIETLIRLMEEEDLLELEVAEDGRRILLRSDHAVAASANPVAVGPAIHPPALAPPVVREEQMPESCVAVKSPMMGVFYRAPAPDADPYVREGDAVEVGDVLALIEAMKVFNEITAEAPGRIVRVLPQNEQEVKVDEVLFWMESAV
jgi:acetyl-CoA carboxylase biotin carboxyl carrier protein